MVFVGYIKEDGRGVDPEDKTTFLYSKKYFEDMKRLVDDVDFGIFRDARVNNKELEVLVRRTEGQPCVKFAVEMIPVQGQIYHVQSPWSNEDSKINHMTFLHRYGVHIGIRRDNHSVSTLEIWYSREGYMEEHPDANLDKEDVVRETPKNFPQIL